MKYRFSLYSLPTTVIIPPVSSRSLSTYRRLTPSYHAGHLKHLQNRLYQSRHLTTSLPLPLYPLPIYPLPLYPPLYPFPLYPLTLYPLLTLAWTFSPHQKHFATHQGTPRPSAPPPARPTSPTLHCTACMHLTDNKNLNLPIPSPTSTTQVSSCTSFSSRVPA